MGWHGIAHDIRGFTHQGYEVSTWDDTKHEPGRTVRELEAMAHGPFDDHSPFKMLPRAHGLPKWPFAP